MDLSKIGTIVRPNISYVLSSIGDFDVGKLMNIGKPLKEPIDKAIGGLALFSTKMEN